MVKYTLITFMFLFILNEVYPQNFYRDREPKINFYQVSLGTGLFYSAPRLSYDTLVNMMMPAVQLGAGRRISDHFLLYSSMGLQPFSTKEMILEEESKNRILQPVFDGFSYNFEVLPTFSLIPSYHHIGRSFLDLHIGVGLGYLFTYRTEKLFFNEKYYKFNLIEQGLYIPLKATLVIKIGRITDVGIEGNFLYTFLDGNRDGFSTTKDSDHLGRLSFIFRRYFE
jgi:hypothetical protein